jgi:hypothetical protein
MNLPLLAILAAAVVVVAGLAAVLLATWSGRRRLRSELDEARADVETLRARVEALAHRADEPADPQEFVITSLDDSSQTAPVRLRSALAVPEGGRTTLPAGEFVTVALSESVVRLVSLGYGVRRALSAENRNRIRFEMRREVKRARRQRRRDLKEARRHLRDGRHADLGEDAA